VGKQGEHGELDGAFIVGKFGDTGDLVGAEDEGSEAPSRSDGVRLTSPSSNGGVGGDDENDHGAVVPLFGGDVIGEPTTRFARVDGELHFDDDHVPWLGLRAAE
jgi:hypothetical protein